MLLKLENYFGKIIDVHTHIFPLKIAEKATASVGAFYELPMKTVGKLDVLLEDIKRYGIRHSFLLSTATTPSQVRHINNFLIENMKLYGDLFTAFGTVHPHMEKPCEEIEYIRFNGIKGLKFHPDFQQFQIDDTCMNPIYDMAQEQRIPIMIHAGDNRYDFSNPKRLLNISKKFPKLIVIAANFGGYNCWQESLEILCDTDFYFDTSSSLFSIEYNLATAIINKKGEDYIMFGTDFPMWRFEDEIKRFEKLYLSDKLNEKLLFKNAENFLKLI